MSVAAATHPGVPASLAAQSAARQTIAPTGPSALQERVQALVAPYVNLAGVPGKAIGMVVGLSSCEGQLILGFGAKVRFGSVPPAADDIFEIGSVTKVFTGYLHARALERGSVGLTDPIDPYFPAGVPHWGSQSIQ